jgi:hypothetical protein
MYLLRCCFLAEQETAHTEVLYPPGRPAALFHLKLRPEPLRPILSDGLPLSSGLNICQKSSRK